MGVPPGSADSKTSRPDSRSRAASRRSCVDFPLPSGPSNVMNFPRTYLRLVVNIVQNFFEIFPGFALRILVVGPQEVRRMERDHHRQVTPLVPFAAQPGHAFLRVEERLRRRR